ncbi:ferric reductase-like transmembrane domain-containing protein [Pseudalkalibacillus hwajinpoensis]|uniref:ferric reductase-like transmembrane domain-containing protein n=1 Tax=Guptibacillus hwajinpoensis TaxID=208199 RepID=UPI001CFE17D9|nr:ferric reductase-like transmembrane domain-containing protein [Pseudalkalibacillus hwajinpoensis]
MVLTTWEWTRASGLTSFVLLFFSIFAGLLHSSPTLKREWKSRLYFFHQTTGWLGFLVIVFHAVILLYDQYVSYEWYAVLVPFMSSDHRILNGIGTLAFYGVFLILLSSDMMKKVGRSLWKKIHLFSLPAYLLALIHGAFIGTDNTSSLVLLIYVGTSVLIIAIFLFKRMRMGFKKGKVAQEG